MDEDDLEQDRAAVRQSWFARFEAQGEQAVRDALTDRLMTGRKAVWAQTWISSLDEARAASRENRRDEISEETLAEARMANSIAERAIEKAQIANTNAAIASIIAVVAIAVSIVTAIYSN